MTAKTKAVKVAYLTTIIMHKVSRMYEIMPEYIQQVKSTRQESAMSDEWHWILPNALHKLTYKSNLEGREVLEVMNGTEFCHMIYPNSTMVQKAGIDFPGPQIDTDAQATTGHLWGLH